MILNRQALLLYILLLCSGYSAAFPAISEIPAAPFANWLVPEVKTSSEGLFVFYGDTSLFLPISKALLATLPERTRNSLIHWLVMTLAFSQLKTVLWLASLYYPASIVWQHLYDEWHGNHPRHVPLMFSSPMMRERLMVEFIQNKKGSRWVFYRIPAAPVVETESQQMNPIESSYYQLWSAMSGLGRDRLVLRWDDDKEGWVSEFDNDSTTSQFWQAPEIHVLSDNDQTVNPLILHPAWLSRFSHAIEQSETISELNDDHKIAYDSPEILNGNWAHIISFDENSGAQQVWLRDSSLVSWQSTDVFMLAESPDSYYLLSLMDSPAMATWQHQRAPVMIQPVMAEWLVQQVINSALHTVLSPLHNWIMQGEKSFSNQFNAQANKKSGPVEVYREASRSPQSILSEQYLPMHQHGRGNGRGNGRGHGKTQHASSAAGSTRDQVAPETSRSSDQGRGRGGRGRGRGRGHRGGGGPPPPAPVASNELSVNTPVRRANKRSSPGEYSDRPSKIGNGESSWQVLQYHEDSNPVLQLANYDERLTYSP